MEIVNAIHLLKTPIPKKSLACLNAYLVKTDEGCLLIDTGWPSTEAFNALVAEIAGAGVSMGDLRYILVTHAHPDHFGLAERLRQQTGAKLVMHELEYTLQEPLFRDFAGMVERLSGWLQLHDVRDQVWQGLTGAAFGMNAPAENHEPDHQPDQMVGDGEHFTIGDFDFEILLTPGHSPGHICLYERSRQLLFSGDHVLSNIVPTVGGANSQSISNPLLEYLNALRRLEELPVKMVLPAHGDPFFDLPKRAEEIRQHHEERMRIIAQAFSNEPMTTREIIETLRWTADNIAWSELPPLPRLVAVNELLGHLELMHAQGRLDQTLQDGLVRWTLTKIASKVN